MLTSRGTHQYRRHQTADDGGPFRCSCRSCELARERHPDVTRAIEAEVAGARSYVVGLPVVVTVYPDGVVTVDVDTSEAGAAMRELDDDQHDHTEAQIEADADVVDAYHEKESPPCPAAPRT